MDPGTKLGPYEILEPLGAGGMGEVYLAEDTRLHRKVAVKVLPQEYANDPERLARFEQEARAAAALNHPHIAAVHDIGVEGVTHYIVQEHLTGQTLRDRIRRGRLPLQESLTHAREIAEALRAAHEAGIVHRDLKPENVFITTDGHAKVLDFGLAKLVEPGAHGEASSATMSPTVVGTVAGQILGTAGYMAPEQVEADEVDHRADVFAFGCVLYELTTGQQPFLGKNLVDTLSRITNAEPAGLVTIDDTLPAELQRILDKCLAKNPAARHQSAADLAVDLRNLAGVVEIGSYATLASLESSTSAAPGLHSGAVAALIVAAFALGGVAAWTLLGRPDPEVRRERRLIVNTPAASYLNDGAISPDGRRTAFTGGGGLWVRDLDRIESRNLVTAPEAASPFWSPDGLWIAYTVRNQVLKLPVNGGQPTVVGTVTNEIVPGIGGGFWTDDDRLLISAGFGGVLSYPAGGGKAEVVVPETETEHFHGLTGLPGTRALLVTVDPDDGANRIDLWADGARRPLIDGPATRPRWWNQGFVLFNRGTGAIWALPFDAQELVATGEPFVLIPRGRGVSTANDGSFLYFHPGDREHQLVWVDRAGALRETLATSSSALSLPAISSMTGRAAYLVRDNVGQQVWWWDPARGVPAPLNEAAGYEGGPAWSPDGNRIYYASPNADTEDAEDFQIHARDLRTGATALVQLDGYLPAVTSDGSHLLFVRNGTRLSQSQLLYMPLVPEPGEAVLIADSSGTYSSYRVSPDGRHIAYFHSPTGYTGIEVYVDQFPESAGRVRISDGGLAGVLNSLAWSPDGRRLFYTRATTGSMMEVEIAETDSGDLQTTEPREIFSGLASDLDLSAGFALSPDGERFLMVRSTVPAGGDAGGFVLVDGSRPR